MFYCGKKEKQWSDGSEKPILIFITHFGISTYSITVWAWRFSCVYACFYCIIKSNCVTYFPVSSRYSPTLVAKSTICSKMSLQLVKCFLYLLWARSAAILLQNSSSFLISSAPSNLACWAKAYIRPRSERWNERRRHHINVPANHHSC